MPLEAIEVAQGVVFSQALAGALEDVVVENETSLIDVAVVLGSTSERFEGGSDAAQHNNDCCDTMEREACFRIDLS